MSFSEHYSKAVVQIEEGLKKDPRTEKTKAGEAPKEWIFVQSCLKWLPELEPNPSEEFLIALRGHVLNRWQLQRADYPMNPKGYHQWRHAQSQRSADDVEKILQEVGYEKDFIDRVKILILKTTFPKDPEAQLLEDVTCLAFMELKYESYLTEWDEPKYLRILVGTLEKMTSKARTLAGKIHYSDQGMDLLKKAIQFLSGFKIKPNKY